MTTDRRLIARMRELCGDVGPDDGIDPRRLKKSPRNTNNPRLAGQIARAVRRALASSDDPLLLSLWVVQAVPDPDASRYRIELTALDDLDPHLALERLHGARGWVRSEVARIVNRRRTPDLRFVWVEEG
jgi:ribosome-binding factor A